MKFEDIFLLNLLIKHFTIVNVADSNLGGHWARDVAITLSS